MEIFLLVGGATIFGFLLILVTALGAKRKVRTFEREPFLTSRQFEKVCLALLDEMRLVVEESDPGENKIDIRARNPAPIVGGELLIHCLYLSPQAVVGPERILELSNRIVSERVSKGIFITTGRFTPELSVLGELAPIEFIDGERLQQLVSQYRIYAKGP